MSHLPLFFLLIDPFLLLQPFRPDGEVWMEAQALSVQARGEILRRSQLQRMSQLQRGLHFQGLILLLQR